MKKLSALCLQICLMLGCVSLVSAQSLKKDSPGNQREKNITAGKKERDKNAGKIVTAVNCRTQFASFGNKRIAYRSIGKGKPIILCNRLRGVLDSWDPAFLDELGKTFQVFIFDYSGIGSSGGTLPLKIADVAEDISFLAAHLKLDKFALGGWSFGGLVAQTFATHHPEKLSHLILLGTNPPGANKHPLERAFLDATMKVDNDLNDELVLFFEPKSAFSRAAARQSNERIAARTIDRDPPVPQEVWPRYFAGAKDYAEDAYGSRDKLATINVPILVISGDHDPACPIENWYALNGKLPNLQLIMLGQTGHGPQHQYPELTVAYINTFAALAEL
jgi:pimeloyl-ACP methyl ester carboxylesterase